MSDSDTVLRIQVASCTRMLAMMGIMGYSGHVSARIAGGETFLIQTFDDVRENVLPERLLVADLDGKHISGDGEPPSEIFIHSEIYRGRTDVGSIAHVHHDPTTLFSLVEGIELVPMKNYAARWPDGVPTHHDASHISSAAQGRAVGKTLGSKHALLLRGHGEVVVAEDVPAVFIDTVHLVENAEVLAQAARLGRPIPLTSDELAAFLATFDRKRHVEKVWNFHLDRAVREGVLPTTWQGTGASERQLKAQ